MIWNWQERLLKKKILIDKMERKFRKNHILRLNEGRCTAQSGMVFVDIVSNLERIGDHAVNIAEAILGNEHNSSYRGMVLWNL